MSSLLKYGGLILAETETHEVVKVIDPDMGTGWDYDSLYDWEAAQQGDLTGARNEIAVAKCRCTGGTADTSRCNINGWTLSATQYIKIWTDTSESYRHDGKWITGNHYRMEINEEFSFALNIAEDYVIVEGLQCKDAWAGSNPRSCINIDGPGATSEIRILETIVEGGQLSGINCGSGISRIINCVSHGSSQSGILSQYGGGVPTVTVYNCVCANNVYGFRNTGGTYVAKNCYAGGNSTDDYNGTITKTTCASEDTTGSAGLQEIAFSTSAGAYFTNVTVGSEDFHIGASSALIGVATNLYNDATYPFQDDIDGDDRGGSGAQWDIGADEYVSTDINPNVSDSITITDVVTVDNSTVPLDTSDACVVSEGININLSIEVSIFDEIVLTEDIATGSDSIISTYDELNISEYIDNLVSECVLDTYDLVIVSEYSIVYTEQLGTVVWGHDTGVEESVAKNFQGNWTGTGSISGSGDEEVLEIETGKYMESENIQLGTGNVVIALNKYRSGTLFPVRKYKTATAEGDLAGLGWSNYTDQFYCEGWVKIRLEAA